MDNLGLYEREGHYDAFTDLLFNALLGFAFMFFIAFLLINPDAEAGKVELKAEFIITVAWPDRHPDDIDTYVQDPVGNIVWYNWKEAGLMHLDRDDRGNYRDTILVKGKPVASPLNQETVTLRGIVAGEYTVNIFHFLATSTDAVPVSIKVEKINPSVSVVYYDTLELDHRGHERTAVRFRVSSDGSIENTSFRQKSLAREVHKE